MKRANFAAAGLVEVLVAARFGRETVGGNYCPWHQEYLLSVQSESIQRAI